MWDVGTRCSRPDRAGGGAVRSRGRTQRSSCSLVVSEGVTGEGACGRESRGCGVAGLVGASASGPASPSPRPPAWPLALLPRVRFFSRPGGTDPSSSRAGSWLSYLAAGPWASPE